MMEAALHTPFGLGDTLRGYSETFKRGLDFVYLFTIPFSDQCFQHIKNAAYSAAFFAFSIFFGSSILLGSLQPH